MWVTTDGAVSQKASRSTRRLWRVLTIAIVGLLLLEVSLSLALPRYVPRMGFLPQPSEQSWFDGCNGHRRHYVRSGVLWVVTENHTLVSCQKVSGPQLPERVSDWLRQRFTDSSMGHATYADWVLTTHGQAATITSGVLPSDKAPVYLIDVHGSFVWHHSCPAGAPPTACTSVGTDEVFTVDPQRMQVLDFGVEARPPDLTRFGTVRHISIR